MVIGLLSMIAANTCGANVPGRFAAVAFGVAAVQALYQAWSS